MRKSQIVFLSIVASWSAPVVTGAVTLFLTPILIHALGSEGYALIPLISSVLAYANLSSFGAGPAIGREIALAYGKGDIDAVNKNMSVGAIIYAALALFTCIAILVLSPFIIAWFRVSDELAQGARTLLILAGITQGILFLSFPLNRRKT